MGNAAPGRCFPASARGADLLLPLLMAAALACGCTSSGPTEPGNGDHAEPGMTLVPAGTFVMGDGVAHCGGSEHEVVLTRGFYLGLCEVTNAKYLEALQWAYDHGYVTASESTVQDALDGSGVELLDLDDSGCEITFDGGVFSIRNTGQGLNPDHPVKEVTWFGAARYCDWLSLQVHLPRAYAHSGDWLCNDGDPYGAIGYRLPTDAEWEYAAQYDDERIYPWGDDAATCERANYGNCIDYDTPVASYPDAPAALGLSDMAGNVREWCNDFFQCSLGTEAQQDPVGPATGFYRVLRGGSWGEGDSELRCAARNSLDPPLSHFYIGFRVARSAERASGTDATWRY